MTISFTKFSVKYNLSRLKPNLDKLIDSGKLELLFIFIPSPTIVLSP